MRLLKKPVRDKLSNFLTGPFLLRRGAKIKRMVSLTFDDGPSEFTEDILKILRNYSVKATFFLNGSNIQKKEVETKEIFEEGHEIGIHSFSHQLSYSMVKLYNELRITDELIKRTTSVRPKLFRSPYGRINLASLMVPIFLGLRHVLWSVDPEDFLANNAQAIVETFSKFQICKGDIILLHDKTKYTVEALPRIIEKILAEKFVIGKVSEII
ncbi:MAG: polysaccharide deacetylase family protein [Candidatus Omnitrophota bacterium]